ncbi:hypothetical protein HY224_03570, partial [Candidatus Uhrbacteria bacterium]|nr:hypothetical protein [Candidatus Uhrbacteria bacterium]
MSLNKYSIAAGLAGAMLIINQLLFRSPILGVFLMAVYVALMAVGLARGLDHRTNGRFIWGLPLFLGILVSLGAIIYFFYEINLWVVDAFLLWMPAGLPLLNHLKSSSQVISPPLQKTRLSKTQVVLALPFLLLITKCFQFLWRSASSSSLTSPFQVLNPHFFVYYLLSSILLMLILRRGFSKISQATTTVFYFLSFSMALIIYKVGFGFDPFIHQATEKFITQHGAIDPKPLYYLGQYFLVVFLNKTTFLSIEILDKYLVPVLSAVLIPGLLLHVLNQWEKRLNLRLLTWAPIFLILPFSSFTLTTPQSLANLFLIIVMLTGLDPEANWLALLIPALGALFIQPLAGIPALIFVGLMILRQWSNQAQIWHKLIWLLLIFLASISLPLVFLIQSHLSSQTVSQLRTPDHWLSALAWLLPNFDRYFSWHFDIVYFWANNLHLILLLAALLGIGLVIRKNLWPTLNPYFWTFFILLCNYFFLSNLVKFLFLIDYEQNNYPGRLLEIGFYFLIPFILAAWQFIFSRTGQWRQGAGILTLALLITNSLYFTYPRANKFEPGHNISTSQTDIETVHSIDQVATGDYVV